MRDRRREGQHPAGRRPAGAAAVLRGDPRASSARTWSAARSGVEALRAADAARSSPSILLDVNMPGMDGFETAALIHQHPRFEQTPIIFVTGVHVTELDRLKGYKLGAVDYVSIPVVPEILRSKVAVLVELHCQRASCSGSTRAWHRPTRSSSRRTRRCRPRSARELERLNAHLLRRTRSWRTPTGHSRWRSASGGAPSTR